MKKRIVILLLAVIILLVPHVASANAPIPFEKQFERLTAPRPVAHPAAGPFWLAGKRDPKRPGGGPRKGPPFAGVGKITAAGLVR